MSTLHVFFIKYPLIYSICLLKSYLTGEEDLIAMVYAGNKFNMYSSIFGYKLTFQQVAIDLIYLFFLNVLTYLHISINCGNVLDLAKADVNINPCNLIII